MSDTLPAWLEAAVQRETAGKSLRWIGRPGAWRAFAWTSLIWIFGIPWLAFSLFWEGAVLGSLLMSKGAPFAGSTGQTMGWVMALFGLPFVLIGLGMLLAPFAAFRTARRTVYALTNKRFITITEGRTRHVKSILPDLIRSIERKERPDGSGNLRLILGLREGRRRRCGDQGGGPRRNSRGAPGRDPADGFEAARGLVPKPETAAA